MRKLLALAAILCASHGALAGPARADAGGDAAAARATLACDHVATPGRVRCDVEARVEEGEEIDWADVVIVKTPPFASALRGRIGPHDATTHEAGVWRWALALVAREKGAGDVEGRVRLVVCRAGKCAAREVPVTARVVVGD